MEYIYDYYGTIPSFSGRRRRSKSSLDCFRDLIAYRVVVSIAAMPHCRRGRSREDEEDPRYLYEIANAFCRPLWSRGASGQSRRRAGRVEPFGPYVAASVYVRIIRDYISDEGEYGYRSLHITFYDDTAKCFMEVQLKDKGDG